MTQAFDLEISKEQNIKEILKIQEILKVTVETTRKIIKCDRVIICSVSKPSRCLVLAESVDSKYASIVGKTIKEPFLGREYSNLYYHNLVLTIDDIYQADKSQSDLEDLEKLEVKSLAIAPISINNKVSCFLAAYQCDRSQSWHSETVNFLREGAKTTGRVIAKIFQANKSQDLNSKQKPAEEQESLNYSITEAKNNEKSQEKAPVREQKNIIEQEQSESLAEVESKITEKRKMSQDFNSRQKPAEEEIIPNSSITEAKNNGNSQENYQVREQKAIVKEERSETLAEIKSKITEEENLWTKYFPEAIQQIRQSLKSEDILKTSVKEVRRVLNCDRVVVYSLNQDNYGTIVAEAVVGGWTKAEGKVIQDPCFEARYFDQYRNGRVRAWNNIYEAGMSKCHVEQLEQLEVKANLVTPIIKDEELFGLLVAHQCSNSRQWEQTEILWVTQIATQIGFALDNARLLADAQRLREQVEDENRWTEYFTDSVQQIRQSLKTEDILKTSVREARRILNCDRVVVYSITPENYGLIAAESVTSDWIRAEGRVIKDPCFESKYLDQYSKGRVRAWSNIYEAGMSSCYVEQLEKLQVKANLVTPITNEGKLFGLLVAHQCSGFRDWQKPEIRWLTQIANQVGLALNNAQMLEQLQQSTQDTLEMVERAVNNVSNIQRTFLSLAVGFDNLNNSCQNFSETINTVKNVSKQIAQQSMGIARVVNRSQIEENTQNSIMDLSETIFSLMQELFEATAKIDPLFANIKTEVEENKAALDSETQKLVSGVREFQTVRQKLDRVVALNHKMSNLIETISEALENKIQSSTFARDSVQELADITERISQQSMDITQSFNQLVVLGLGLEPSYPLEKSSSKRLPSKHIRIGIQQSLTDSNFTDSD